MTDPLTLTAAAVEALEEGPAAEVLTAWVKAGRPELPEALASSTSKVHARLAKKALYQLRSRGVAVSGPPSPSSAPSLAPTPAADDAFPGVLSGILGTGERAFFFGRPRRGGGMDAYQGVLSDELGVLQLDPSRSTRGQYREHLTRLTTHPTLKVLAVPFERIALELGRALAMNERSRTALPPEADLTLRTLGVTAVDPEWALPALEASDGAQASAARALLKEPELEQWYPSESALITFGQALDALLKSPLALTEAQQYEQVERRACAEAAAYLTTPRRQVYGRRLWQMAELLEHSARGSLALVARAEARRLFHTTEPSRFFEGIFLKVATQRLDAQRHQQQSPGATPR